MMCRYLVMRLLGRMSLSHQANAVRPENSALVPLNDKQRTRQ